MRETSKSQYHWKCVVGLERDKQELKMVAICEGKDHKCVFIGEREGRVKGAGNRFSYR